MTPCTGPSALDAAIMAFKDDPRSCAHDDCPCCHAAFDLVAMLRASAPAERSLAAALARVEALREALLAYQDANRIHNDSEAERYAKGEAALASPGEGAETTTGDTERREP